MEAKGCAARYHILPSYIFCIHRIAYRCRLPKFKRSIYSMFIGSGDRIHRKTRKGAYIASRLLGENHRSALTIGISMNTRGLMELITLNIGYDLGVLPKQMFTMLVIMSIVSTYMATPLIRHLMASERHVDAPLAQEI